MSKISSYIKTALFAGSAGAVATLLASQPNSLHQRRALLNAKWTKAKRLIHQVVREGLNDVSHRAKGAVFEMKGRYFDHDVTEQRLHDRVRAAIGHHCSKANAIDVEVKDRTVTLRGVISPAEQAHVENAAANVRGVESVISELHSEGGTTQPGGEPPSSALRPASAFRRESWPPSYRCLAGACASLMLGYGLKRRRFTGKVSTIAGSLLMLRAGMNKSLGSIFGLRKGVMPVHLRKSVHLDIPVEQAFTLFERPEAFPEYMRNVRHVERNQDGSLTWKVRGPAGVDVSFTTEQTISQKPRRIAWQSVPGSMIEQEGHIFFESHGDKTTAHIDLRYSPPAGALGHVLAALFQSDPKSEMNADLVRLKGRVSQAPAPLSPLAEATDPYASML